VIVQFVGGVTAVQLRLIPLEDRAAAVTVGAEGTPVQVLTGNVVALTWAEAADAPSASTASTL
jgi:hypothetical protein